ncbi:AdoMet_MTases domain containing protein [Candidatus Nanopelagicaceae bacterium]
MHKSAYEIGAKFLDRYMAAEMKSVLEVGAFDVNGSLKDFKREGCEWLGVDLEPGKGVDIVIERASKLPFEDNSFDLVVATSVFEHDPTFWLTFNEMLRVVKPEGFVYICAPSNGWVHRYPMDVYRFYPDAGIGLVEWGRREFPELELIESFISERDGDIWNDFCAVFSKTKTQKPNKIHMDTKCSNIWSDGVFLEDSLLEATEDMRLIENLIRELTSNESVQLMRAKLKEVETLNLNLQSRYFDLENKLTEVRTELTNSAQEVVAKKDELRLMQQSMSWQITSPLRTLKSWIRK